MVTKELVTDVNEKLVALRDEAVTQQENPRMIAFMNQVIRLTNIDEDGREKSAPIAVQEIGGQLVDVQTTLDINDTHHTHVPNVFGNCGICGACLHERKSPDGTACMACGKELDADGNAIEPVVKPAE